MKNQDQLKSRHVNLGGRVVHVNTVAQFHRNGDSVVVFFWDGSNTSVEDSTWEVWQQILEAIGD